MLGAFSSKRLALWISGTKIQFVCLEWVWVKEAYSAATVGGGDDGNGWEGAGREAEWREL